jgi:hypothetical protein
MISLSYPTVQLRERQQERVWQLFDPFRKKWVQRTPEEWVRQYFLQLLTLEHAYPTSAFAVEKTIRLGQLSKRFDILIYDRQHQPWMMIECKAETVSLDERVKEQLLHYNLSVPVRYLLITNGPYCLGWERKDQQLLSIQKIPAYPV